MRKIFKKLIASVMAVCICTTAFVSTASAEVESITLSYSTQRPSSLNVVSDTLDIDPIRTTYAGVYGWQCYAHCTSITTYNNAVVSVWCEVYINSVYSGSGEMVKNTKIGNRTTTTNAPTSYANCRLMGDYCTYMTLATIQSCNDF